MHDRTGPLLDLRETEERRGCRMGLHTDRSCWSGQWRRVVHLNIHHAWRLGQVRVLLHRAGHDGGLVRNIGLTQARHGSVHDGAGRRHGSPKVGRDTTMFILVAIISQVYEYI